MTSDRRRHSTLPPGVPRPSDWDESPATDPEVRAALGRHKRTEIDPLRLSIGRVKTLIAVVVAVFSAGGASVVFLQDIARKADVNALMAQVQEGQFERRLMKAQMQGQTIAMDRLEREASQIKRYTLAIARKLAIPVREDIEE